MASAILARRNEPHWAETKVYMRKPHPNSNPNPNPNPNPNKAGPNANPNPNFAPIAGDHATDCDDALPSSTAAFSDDSSSFNRKKAAGPGHRGDYGGYITFNISTYSKKELRDLKRRLESELEQVRSLVSRIESREIQSSARSVGHSASGVYGGGGGREVTSSAGLHHLDAMGSDGFVERSAAHRAGQYYHQPPEISMPKDKKKAIGGARPLVSPRGPKRLAVAPESESEKALAGLMSKCRQILTKLMKHKGSIWFNKPVDVEGMKLHDYNTIIKNPMDLGTVRTKLTKGNYPSPVEFAADIRLTFNNALLYNPAGHVVNVLAGQLLRLFEDEFCSVYEKYENQQSDIVRAEGGEKQRSSSWARAAPAADHASSTWARAAPMADHAMNFEPVPTISPPQSVPTPALAPNPLPVSPLVQQQQQTIIGRPVMVRLPKPKAKEPNKRPMTIEEKGKLTHALQSLPPEKMDHVLQIVRKRNGDLVQHDDEIELDFEVMDTETLWELDRFVGNCKKMMSKIKRQEAMANDMISGPLDSAPAEAGDKSPMAMAGETPDRTAAKRIKKVDPGDEDVDIGEEMPPANYPPVEIEKDNAGCASNSSSSGSDSSSSSGSSGSDSDSSSGSDSDDDVNNNNNNNNARSPAGGFRRSPSN